VLSKNTEARSAQIVLHSLATDKDDGTPWLFAGRHFVRRPELRIPASRYFVLIIGLFALFCYTQELEQLGRALIGPNPGKKTG
jgi:hypothetical protein